MKQEKKDALNSSSAMRAKKNDSLLQMVIITIVG